MKKQIELSAEELKVIEQMRAEKAAEEQAEREEQARAEAADKIHDKFEKALNAAHKQINEHIENARSELKKAVAISEKTGIPFSTDVVEFSTRLYVPTSMAKKWPDVDSEILEEFDLYSYYGDSTPGWEYWSASSLTC